MSSSKLLLGGSWIYRSQNELSNPSSYDIQGHPGFNSQKHSMFIGSKHNYFSKTPYMQHPQNKEIIWDLTVNDVVSDMDLQIQEQIHNMLAVLIWNGCDGTFYDVDASSKTNADLQAGYYNYGYINFGSTETNNPIICTVNNGNADWYFVYVLINDLRECKFVITEGTKKVYFDCNQSAFKSKQGGIHDIIAIPYYSKTGTFTVKAYSSGTNNPDVGFFMGVRKKGTLQPVTIMRSIARWDTTLNTEIENISRTNQMNHIFEILKDLYDQWGGSLKTRCLLTSGYMMSDKVHIDYALSNTSYIHAQFIDNL